MSIKGKNLILIRYSYFLLEKKAAADDSRSGSACSETQITPALKTCYNSDFSNCKTLSSKNGSRPRQVLASAVSFAKKLAIAACIRYNESVLNKPMCRNWQTTATQNRVL